jgi:dephospho-CoA kinase
MYTYKDASYTDDQIKKAAEQSNMTVKEYLKKLEGDKDPEPKIKDGDLLDPNFQQDAAAGANAGSQPMTASQAGYVETEDTELLSEDTSSDSVKVKLPKDRKYGKIFEIPNFKKQSPKDIANAYNQMYGGKDGGFEFTSNVNNVTIKALNGESITVNTKGLSNPMAQARMRQADPFDLSGSKTSPQQGIGDDPQEVINNFLKENFNEDLNVQNQKNIKKFESSITDNIEQLAYDYIESEDIPYDPTMPINSLMKSDGFRDYVRKNSVEKYAENRDISGSGFFGSINSEDIGLTGTQPDKLVDKMLQDMSAKEEQLNEYNIIEQYVKPLKESGNWLEASNREKLQHINSIKDPKQKELAKVNDRLIKIKESLNQPNTGVGDVSQSALSDEFEKLKERASLLLKQAIDEDAEFLFASDGTRISPALAKASGVDVVDLTKDYDIAKVELKKKLDTSDSQTIQNDYRIHLAEFSGFQEEINTRKFDIKIKAGFMQEGSPLAEKLFDRGYSMIDTKGKETTSEYATEGVIKGVTLKDLMAVQPGFATDEIVISKPESRPGEATITMSDLAGYVANTRQTQKRLSTEHAAWKQLYLLNVDPGSIKANDIVSQGGNFMAGVLDALPGQGNAGSDSFRKDNLFRTDRDDLNDAEALINKVNSTLEPDQKPFELSAEQMDSFKQGFGEQFWTGLGGFVPMIAELGLVSAMTGGMGNSFGVANYLSKLKNVTYLAKTATKGATPISRAVVAAKAKQAKMSVDAYVKSQGLRKATGTAFNKAQALFIQGAQEEGKMKLLKFFGVDMPTGAGAGFVIGGHAMRKILPTNVFKGFSGAAAMNTALEKGLYSGLGGAAGAQTAAPLEALIADLQNKKSFDTFVEEKYGDMEDWAKHAFMEALQFSVIGLTHASKADRSLTMQSKRNLLLRTNKEITDRLERGDVTDQLGNQFQLRNELINQIRVAENRERFLDKNVLAAETQGLLQKFNKQYKKENGTDAFTMNVSTNGEGMKLGEGESAAVTKRNGKLHVDVDVSKMNEGTLPHEIYHVVSRLTFGKDVGVQKALQEGLAKSVGKMDFETVDPRTGEIRNIENLPEAVKEAYEKTQDKDSTFEEFNANLIDLLSRPENRDMLIENNVLGSLKQNINTFLEKSLTGTALENTKLGKVLLPELNNPDAVVKFLSRLSKDFGKGNYSPKLIKRFQDIEITKDGKKLIEKQTGKVLNIDKTAQKELKQESLDLSNANKKAFEEFEATGNKSDLIGKVYENNQGLIQSFVNRKFVKGLGVSREMFEGEVGSEIYDKILGTYLKRDAKLKDVPFGAYARQALFGGGAFGGGRLGNILKRLGQQGDLFNKDLESKEAQSVMSEETRDFDEKIVSENKKTDPKELQLSIDVVNDLVPEVQKDLQEKSLTKETYKSLRLGENAAKALAKAYDIREKDKTTSDGKKVKGDLLPEWFTVPARNLPQGSMEGFRKLRSELNKNAQMVLNILPEGYTLDKKSTGVPNSIQEAFYNKRKIGSKNVYELKKNISIKDVKDLLKEPEGKLYRDKQVQQIKGLAELVFRGLVNNVARSNMKIEGATAIELQKLADGKNPMLAQQVLGKLKNTPGLNEVTIKRLIGNFLVDREKLRETNPTFVERFESEIIQDNIAKAEEGKADAPTFKTSDKADIKIAEINGAPKGVDISNIIDGNTGKSMRSTETFKRKTGKFKKGVFIKGTEGPEMKRSIFDTARLETFLDGISELSKYYPEDLQKYFTKEVLLQSFGSTSRGTARNVGKDARKITTEGKLMSESDLSKGQYERITDNLGKLYKEGVFDNIEPGDFMSDAQQKNALQKFQNTGDINVLNKYINSKDNAYKSDVYYAMGVAKQKYLYDAKTSAEFEKRAKVIYQLAAENSGATSGYGRQFVPIMAVKKTGEPGRMKLEHLKSSLEQSMQEAKAIVEGRWMKDGKKIMNDYKGIISFKKYLDVIDKLGGVTNTSGLARMVLDFENLKDYVTVESGFKETLYDKLMTDNAQRVGAKLRELNVPWMKDKVAAISLEPSKSNEVLLKSSLDNKADVKSSWKANVELSKKAGTLDNKNSSNAELLENLKNRDKAISLAQKKLKETKKARVFDFDDTLARTKSNVLYTMPNNEGGFSKGSTKLKAIFMVGGPGAGKTNVGKGLQLGRRGYKVVNQDIALEAMKTESGLPANESNYTAEQRSIRSKLGSAARKAAVAKFDKYAANGDGMVIDGTGASYNATTKKIKALQEKGYEVHMVVANTPLETALERNRARKERSLEDFIVEKTYNQVQESLAKYREDFGDRLYEINTEAIEYGKPLPGDFLQGVYKGINANKVGKVDAATFAKEAGNMEAQGAQWDFSEFSKVMQGSKGPLFEVAKSISESPGERDMFVLTARPADAAPAIKSFLKELGLDIPLENITGLANGAPSAKANWMLKKAAEGYNDFYFADDHLGNVKAVKDVLSVVDVKSKVQLALAQKKLGKTFNDIIQEKTGIASEKVFGEAKAEIMGKSKGKFDVFISPTAEDFAGLLYKTLPKGKKGENALKFYKENLFDPFARAEDNITRDQVALSNDVRALKNRLGIIPKKLRKKNETGFTNEQALRVRMWTKMGLEVPGLSKSDTS